MSAPSFAVMSYRPDRSRRIIARRWLRARRLPERRARRFETPLGVLRYVALDDDAIVADRLRLDQLQRRRRTRLAEQALAAADHEREDHQPVLVDQPGLGQRLHELRASGAAARRRRPP